ncbi:MAG: NADH-ubiquinone oxidoreductase-F iron-sulfur binding region domain-containing protein, partial [Thermotogota bacterium]
GKKLRIIQTGGTAGSFMNTENLETGLDYDSAKQGASLGSGVILCMDEDNCPVDCAKTVMEFFAHESCGKCTPCREGTRVSVNLLDKISKGQGKEMEIDQLLMIADGMEQTSFCGLGQSAAIPLRTIVESFRQDFSDHVYKKACNVCKYEVPKKKKR